MLTVTIPEAKEFIEDEERFITYPAVRLDLEHSLISISKWESKFKKPFLNEKNKTDEEILFYIKCMTINKNVPDEAYMRIPESVILEIYDYINDPMTATTIRKTEGKGQSKQFITSELIYCWMAMAQLPSEYEKWHLNRLLTLIQVYGEESSPKKKKNRAEINREFRDINAERRKKFYPNG